MNKMSHVPCMVGTPPYTRARPPSILYTYTISNIIAFNWGHRDNTSTMYHIVLLCTCINSVKKFVPSRQKKVGTNDMEVETWGQQWG